MCKCIAIPTHIQHKRGVRTRQFKSYAECEKAFNLKIGEARYLIEKGGMYGGFFFDDALDNVDYDVEFKNDD